MSFKSLLIKTVVVAGVSYAAYRGYKFGAKIYAEAKKQIDEEFIKAEAKFDAARCTNSVNDAVGDMVESAKNAADTTIKNAKTATEVLSAVASEVLVEGLNPGTSVISQIPASGEQQSPRFDTAAPGGQEVAGEAGQNATEQNDLTSQLPPVQK